MTLNTFGNRTHTLTHVIQRHQAFCFWLPTYFITHTKHTQILWLPSPSSSSLLSHAHRTAPHMNQFWMLNWDIWKIFNIKNFYSSFIILLLFGALFFAHCTIFIYYIVDGLLIIVAKPSWSIAKSHKKKQIFA